MYNIMLHVVGQFFEGGKALLEEYLYLENKEYTNIKEKKKHNPNYHAIVSPHPTDPDLAKVVYRTGRNKEGAQNWIKTMAPESNYIYI